MGSDPQPSDPSVLDAPAISGQYLFPQPRRVREPFVVEVDGAQLACYRRVVDPEAMTLVHFHGNGECVADYIPDMADALAEIGLNSLFVEYRAYGGSTGEAQLQAMLGDGEAAVIAANVPFNKVIALGRSIGSLYAIELAERQPSLGGLVLESGIADPAERFLIYADLSSCAFSESDVIEEVKRHFNHKRKLSGYRRPLLILHTENDGLVDISHAERNHRWAGSQQKRFVRFPHGTHNSIMSVNWKAYLEEIRQFSETLADD